MIIGEPKGEKNIPEFIIRFEPSGATGMYATEDENVIAKLRKHSDFGRKFMEIGLKFNQPSNIVEGTRSSESHPVLGDKKFEPQKLIEFGKLQGTLLKSDGSYRKDASQENIEKYELLKVELGV